MVPVELLDHIFGLLDGDQSSLKACAKADPSFSKIVERHLYAHIEITYYESNIPHVFSCSQLSNVLSENPQVVKYIRSLRLDMNRWPDGIEPSSILPMLPNLERMTLWSCWSYIPWSNLDELFQKTLNDCLLHSLKDLSLAHIEDFPLSILDKCDNLKRLTLHYLKFDPTHPAEQYSPRCPLEYLSIWAWENFSSRFSAVNLRSLRSFVFRPITHRDFNLLETLFQAWSTSLTTLELFLYRYFRTTYNILDHEHSEFMNRIPLTLSVLSCLEQLTIHADIDLCPEENECIQWIHSALPSIMKLVTTAPSLKKLILNFYYIFSPYEKSPSSLMWSPLTILAGPSFRGHVFLNVIQSSSHALTFDNLILSFKADTQLMMMIDEGKLVIRLVLE